jgi:putative ABC transport system permease protein
MRWGVRLTDELGQNIGYALRPQPRTPPFTAIASAGLPLGIGGGTAIFTVVDSVLMQLVPGE